jgi:hypothetical protein
MAITRKPPSLKAQDAYISGAPDSQQAPSVPPVYEKGVAKGNKRQITLTIAPELLRKVDEMAQRTGQGRAGIINMAIYRAFEGDIFK